MNPTTASSAATRVLSFDPRTTSIDALQRAAYRLSDRLSVDIRLGEAIECTLFAAAGHEPDELAMALRNAVLDEVLRERIRDETAATRNVILALAFSQTGLGDAS